MTRLIAGLIVSIAGAGLSVAQDPVPREQPPVRAEPDGAALRERVRQRLAQLDEAREELRAALARLDEGAPPREALGPGLERLMGRRGWGPRDEPEGLGLWGPPGGPPPVDGPAPEPVPLDEIRAFVNANLPQLAERLNEAERVDPTRVNKMLERMSPRLSDLIRMHRDDPEGAALRLDEMRTAMSILGKARELRRLAESGAADEAITAARDDLRETIARQIDLRDRLEASRLDRADADITAARAALEVRRAERDSIVEDHFKRVVERASDPRGDGGPPDDRGPRRPPRD